MFKQDLKIQKKKGSENMWKEYINSILCDKQVEVLRQALKLNAKVYFYGFGMGKSTVTKLLLKCGFDVDEPGMHLDAQHGAQVFDNGGETICFNIKRETSKVLSYEDISTISKEEIFKWVNS